MEDGLGSHVAYTSVQCTRNSDDSTNIIKLAGDNPRGACSLHFINGAASARNANKEIKSLAKAN